MKYTSVSTVLAVVVSVGILLAIVAAFVTLGSPAEERARKFDIQRENALEQLTYAIDQYWGVNRQLPTALSELEPVVNHIPVLTDPVGLPYEYLPGPTTTYMLCATFDTESRAEPGYGNGRPIYQSYWKHGPERTCFTREVRRDASPILNRPTKLPPVPIE